MQRIEFYDSTDEKINALTPASQNWVEKGIYWPRDKDYFYRIVDGILIPIGKGASTAIASGEGVGVGIKLDGKVIGGVKSLILQAEELIIPQDWEYNVFSLCVQGVICNFGTINIMQ